MNPPGLGGAEGIVGLLLAKTTLFLYMPLQGRVAYLKPSRNPGNHPIFL